jgi:hypothetical protein
MGGNECTRPFDGGDKLGNIVIAGCAQRIDPPGNTRDLESANCGSRSDDTVRCLAPLASAPTGLQSPDQGADLPHEETEHFAFERPVCRSLMRKVI